jgi:hypothetical protein
MANLENTTPFAASIMPSLDREGRDVLLMVVGAQFVLPEPGEEPPRLRLFPIQEPPPMFDEHAGDPGTSSLRREGQSAYRKPATDITIVGDACAPGERPVTSMAVHVRVGPCAVDLRVFGDRGWAPAVTGGVVPSEPAPFVRMPLVWERAYGGVAAGSTEERPLYEPRNPIGCGLQTDPDAAIGQAIPNLEDPDDLLRQVSDRPRPVGVSPLARHWHPRIGYAGTYDDEWRRTRAPLWPLDFDERFFCGAPEPLQASPHLQGGEAVTLRGLHPGGTIAFRLPVLRLGARSSFIDRTTRTMPILDGVVIETTAKRLTLYYRSSIPAPRGVIRHRETLLRLLAPWEEGVRT